MPIDRNTFNEAQRPLEDRILELLTKNIEQAYSMAEIVVEIEEQDPTIIHLTLLGNKDLYNKYQAAIKALVKDGKIEQSEVKGTTYSAGTPWRASML